MADTTAALNAEYEALAAEIDTFEAYQKRKRKNIYTSESVDNDYMAGRTNRPAFIINLYS